MPMDTDEESICCKEVPRLVKLINSLDPRPAISCMTEHPGFESCCLNPWVLEVAYYDYCQNYGQLESELLNEQFRFTAYRQITRWAHGVLGRVVRKPIPSCIVNKIREAFLSENSRYKGVLLPTMDLAPTD